MEQNIGSEGIFRVPPHAKLRDVLKEAYDRGQKYIIYKDNNVTLPIPEYPRAQHQDEVLVEVDPKDAYSTFMAAALIKAWYADLRQPIFTQSCYVDLKRLFGDPGDPFDLQRLTDLLSPKSEWSFLTAKSREILVRHLLPLLSAVASRQEQNKMTAENLAVCFAPALLCGPDQLEDAKMSSIIRRILSEAADLWTQGLRESCDVEAGAFEYDLRLPSDTRDWEDPLEGKQNRVEDHALDENQVTGIILQDNEKESAPPLPPREKQSPPPLPPRSTNSQSRSASGQSSTDSVTRRKPAPPLQVPPRYSTIVGDSPYDVAESPTTYTAVADGFAPPRPDQSDYPEEKKAGTNSNSDSPAPQIVLPKRKTLTAEQIDSAESSIASQMQGRCGMAGRMALPGLTSLKITDVPKRKAVPLSAPVRSETKCEGSGPYTSLSSDNNAPRIDEPAPPYEFRRPSLPASTRAPAITSLARPVYPPNPYTNRPPSKSTSLPVPGTKPRAPSAGLLQRMPSFETSQNQPSLAPPVAPRRLNLKKASVDDLRRLYEERAGTAKTLAEAGKWSK